MEYCAEHAPNGMINVKSRKCKTEGCSKWPSLGKAGSKTAEYCSQHAPDGMVNVKSLKCKTEGCSKGPSFRVAGSKTAEYCTQHAPDGMVNIETKYFRVEGFGKRPSIGVAGTEKTEYCAQHTRLKCDAEGCKGREIDTPHYEKEAMSNTCPSDTKSVLPSLAQARPSSGGSGASRKRERHLDITCTASKRAVSRESAEGSVAPPDIEGQKYNVKRSSSVKTEVQLSL